MNANVHCEPGVLDLDVIDRFGLVDPLDHDQPSDARFVASRRALCRVATVAAEAGARFQREGTGVDPMGWMLAPRGMFGGEAPIDACLERGPFLRGVLVHGPALDLDMGAEEIDDLLDEDAEDDVGEAFYPEGLVGTHGSAREAGDRADLRLFTATFACRDGGRTVHAFHASLAREGVEVGERLLRRFGTAAADAIVVEGFDPGDPMAEALVAPAVARTLALVAAEPASPLAAGLDLTVEQRFVG